MSFTETAPTRDRSGGLPDDAGETGEHLVADAPAARDAESDELVASELLVEEISIDGMCGVY